MVGVAQRFCLRTGNWSGEDPVCIQSELKLTLATGLRGGGGGGGGRDLNMISIVLTVILVELIRNSFRWRKACLFQYKTNVLEKVLFVIIFPIVLG